MDIERGLSPGSYLVSGGSSELVLLSTGELGKLEEVCLSFLRYWRRVRREGSLRGVPAWQESSDCFPTF